MTAHSDLVSSEHRRIRDLLVAVAVQAAAETRGPTYIRDVEALMTAVRLHAGREETAVAGDDAWPVSRRRLLEDAHDDEWRTIVELRTATDFADVRLHLEELMAALGVEEKEIFG